MTHFTEGWDAVQQDFDRRGIPTDQPGFYDHKAFMAHERANASYLNNYACFVNDRQRSSAYDEHARRVVPEVARIYHENLAKTGRLGACVDIAAFVSRALEREGIWNYVVKGSLTIQFPMDSGIGPRYFWTVDENGSQFVAAHAWVAAPPYFVVDVSVQLQPYTGQEAHYLPAVVCDDAPELGEATLDDIVAPSVQRQLAAWRVPEAQRLLRAAGPEQLSFLGKFATRIVRLEGTELKYMPMATTAPDLPFESMRNMDFGGRTGYELYESSVRPAIQAAQEG